MVGEQFERELEQLLNRHAVDSELNIADFALARYVCTQIRHLKNIMSLSSVQAEEIVPTMTQVEELFPNTNAINSTIEEIKLASFQNCDACGSDKVFRRYFAKGSCANMLLTAVGWDLEHEQFKKEHEFWFYEDNGLLWPKEDLVINICKTCAYQWVVGTETNKDIDSVKEVFSKDSVLLELTFADNGYKNIVHKTVMMDAVRDMNVEPDINILTDAAITDYIETHNEFKLYKGKEVTIIPLDKTMKVSSYNKLVGILAQVRIIG